MHRVQSAEKYVKSGAMFQKPELKTTAFGQDKNQNAL